MNIVIGLGNVLFSDEGIGIHIVRELEKRDKIKNTVYADLGSSSMEIDHYLTPDLRKIAVIDCITAKDSEPGCIYILRMEDLQKKISSRNYSLHQLKFIDTLKILSISHDLPDLMIVGISPFDIKTLSPDLSDKMQPGFESIVEETEKKIKDFFNI